MDTRNLKFRRLLALVLAAGVMMLMVLALSAQTTLAEENDEENDGDKPDITIEVVEDIPAADIEESEVPLAATVGSEAFDNTRRMVMVWTLAVVVIAYAIFVLSGMRRRKARRLMKAGTAGGGPDNPNAIVDNARNMMGVPTGTTLPT